MQGQRLPEVRPVPLLNAMTEIRGVSVKANEESSESSESSDSYSDYSSYSSYSYYSDSDDSSDYSDDSENKPVLSQRAFAHYKPSFKQSEAKPASEPSLSKHASSTEGRVNWKLSDSAYQTLINDLFPRVAQGETAPIDSVRVMFEQAGISAGTFQSA